MEYNALGQETQRLFSNNICSARDYDCLLYTSVYTEILAYLDDEKTVTTQDLLLMDVIESDSGCILVLSLIHI